MHGRRSDVSTVQRPGAAASLPMSRSSPVIPTRFRHRVAEHGASGALRDLLEHHGLSYASEPLSEGAVFGFSGALDLRVRIAAAAIPTVDLEGRAPTLELELCRHLGIDARWHATADPAAAWQTLREQLAAGRPTLLRADPALLGYRHGARHDTRHAVVATSHDDGADVVWIADASFPEPQACSTRSLAAALERVVRAMRHPPRPHHPHLRAGLAAVDALAAAWPGLPELAGGRLGATLAALRARVRDGATGGALYRSLQARFLHDAAALLGSPQLGRAALVCDDLADAWRTLAAEIGSEDAELSHRLGAAWVQRICSLEHQHVEALEEHLELHRALAA